MIPNVCITWCQREAKCRWCEQPIMAGQPMITVFFWNKGTENRKWNVKLYFHVKNEEKHHCWEEQGLDYLKLNPYVPYVRKQATVMEPEDRRKRLLILKRKAALDQTIRKLDKTKDNYGERVQSIDAKVANLMLEILPYGGIPKSWVGELLK